LCHVRVQGGGGVANRETGFVQGPCRLGESRALDCVVQQIPDGKSQAPRAVRRNEDNGPRFTPDRFGEAAVSRDERPPVGQEGHRAGLTPAHAVRIRLNAQVARTEVAREVKGG
jgi:hypothetical protein